MRFEKILSGVVILVLVVVSSFYFFEDSVYADNFLNLPEGEYSEGQVLVKFKPNRMSLSGGVGRGLMNAIAENNDLEVEELAADLNIVMFTSVEGESTEDLIRRLSNDPNVEYVEPNYFRYLETVPNDEFFGQQWYLRNTGQTVSVTHPFTGNVVSPVTGKNGADISAVGTFGLGGLGGEEVIVAVIDSGIRYTHEDLAPNMWDGSNCYIGVDDQGRKIPGNCPNHGWSFTSTISNGRCSNPVDSNDPMDTHGHGTRVAGVIGAKGNNGVGVSGVSQTTRLMAVKAGNTTQMCVSDVIKGINFARYNGAHIINASYGGPGFSQNEYNALVNFFNGSGRFLVAAAGNSSTNNDTNPVYPAGYHLTVFDLNTNTEYPGLPGVLSVGSSNQNDALSSFSNFGLNSVHLVAPGTNIATTNFSANNSYVYTSGTSFSAPIVSGAISVLLNIIPSLPVEEVKSLIVDEGDIIPGLDTISGKRLNLENSVQKLLDDFSSLYTPSLGYIVENEIPAGQINRISQSEVTVNFKVVAETIDVPVTLTDFEYSINNGTSFTSVLNGDSSGALDWNPADPEYYYLTVNNFGSDTFYSFSFDPTHPDLIGLNNLKSDEVKIRFKARHGSLTSEFVVSETFSIYTKVIEIRTNPVGLGDPLKSVEVSFESEDEGVTGYRVMLSRDEFFEFTVEPFTAVSPIFYDEQEDDGIWYFHVQSTDIDSNRYQESIQFTLDNSPPVITSIVDDPVATNSKTWSFEADDLSEVEFRYVINDDSNYFVFTNEDYEDVESVVIDKNFEINGDPIVDGTYFIHVQAIDALGHESDVISASFVMDVTPPEPVRLNGVPNSSTTSDNVTILVLQPEGDGLEVVTHYRYRINNGDWSVDTLMNTPISLNDLSVGEKNLEVEGRDAAGNFQTEPTVASWTVVAPPRPPGGGGGGGGGAPHPPTEEEDDEEITSNSGTPMFRNLLNRGSSTSNFSDVVGHWAVEYVNELFARGVVQGRSPGEFAPDDSLTRAEMVKIALESFGYELATSFQPVFPDVNPQDWFALYLVTARNSGIVSGYPDGTFQPNNPISRVEALKILLEASRLNIANVPASNFEDVARGQWFTSFVDFAFNRGIVSGKRPGVFAPSDNVTRAEMAKMAVMTLRIVENN